MRCFDDGIVLSLLQGGRMQDFPHVPVSKGDYVVVQVTESRGHTGLVEDDAFEIY
jgi:hypothetical protein